MDETRHGVVFPRDADGRASTTKTGTTIWAAAASAVDPALADRISTSRSWRHEYLGAVVELTAASTRSATTAVASARAGLAEVAAQMRFERPGTDSGVYDVTVADGLDTVELRGRGRPVAELEVPYRGEQLRGDGLRRQLDRWVAAGILEPMGARCLHAVVDHPEWLDLSDRAFALLGAGAELGPLAPLLDWGATVVAVDLPGAALWDRIRVEAADRAGTLILPTAPGSGPDGVDLLTQLPELIGWLTRAAETKPLTVGSYAYADGAAHVRLAVAGDVAVAALLAARPGTSYAELATPTDAYAVPADVAHDAHGRWQSRGWRGWVQRPLTSGSRGRLYAASYPQMFLRADGTQVSIADTLVPQQGPNYTLAKRIQRWRAIVATADGVTVSANVAPATSTRSVTRNRLLAAAYIGAARFGVEVFEPATSRVLMAGMLVHDLRVSAPPSQHPDEMFASTAMHGGLWRLGYSLRSVLPVAALVGLPSVARRG